MAYETIEVRPHSIHIGAEIDGVDLTRPSVARRSFEREPRDPQ